MSHESSKGAALKRPERPSAAWLQYEREHPRMLFSELKARDPELFQRLRATDELHYVPLTKEELVPQSAAQSAESVQKVYVISEIINILNTAGKKALIRKDILDSGGTPLSTIASKLRGMTRWREHCARDAGRYGNSQYHHSHELAFEIMREFIRGRKGLQPEERERWLAQVSEVFASRGSQGPTV
jgi:hypothetical protein